MNLRLSLLIWPLFHLLSCKKSEIFVEKQLPKLLVEKSFLLEPGTVVQKAVWGYNRNSTVFYFLDILKCRISFFNWETLKLIKSIPCECEDGPNSIGRGHSKSIYFHKFDTLLIGSVQDRILSMVDSKGIVKRRVLLNKVNDNAMSSFPRFAMDQKPFIIANGKVIIPGLRLGVDMTKDHTKVLSAFQIDITNKEIIGIIPRPRYFNNGHFGMMRQYQYFQDYDIENNVLLVGYGSSSSLYLFNERFENTGELNFENNIVHLPAPLDKKLILEYDKDKWIRYDEINDSYGPHFVSSGQDKIYRTYLKGQNLEEMTFGVQSKRQTGLIVYEKQNGISAIYSIDSDIYHINELMCIDSLVGFRNLKKSVNDSILVIDLFKL